MEDKDTLRLLLEGTQLSVHAMCLEIEGNSASVQHLILQTSVDCFVNFCDVKSECSVWIVATSHLSVLPH